MGLTLKNAFRRERVIILATMIQMKLLGKLHSDLIVHAQVDQNQIVK